MGLEAEAAGIGRWLELEVSGPPMAWDGLRGDAHLAGTRAGKTQRPGLPARSLLVAFLGAGCSCDGPQDVCLPPGIQDGHLRDQSTGSPFPSSPQTVFC